MLGKDPKKSIIAGIIILCVVVVFLQSPINPFSTVIDPSTTEKGNFYISILSPETVYQTDDLKLTLSMEIYYLPLEGGDDTQITSVFCLVKPIAFGFTAVKTSENLYYLLVENIGISSVGYTDFSLEIRVSYTVNSIHFTDDVTYLFTVVETLPETTTTTTTTTIITTTTITTTVTLSSTTTTTVIESDIVQDPDVIIIAGEVDDTSGFGVMVLFISLVIVVIIKRRRKPYIE